MFYVNVVLRVKQRLCSFAKDIGLQDRILCSNDGSCTFRVMHSLSSSGGSNATALTAFM